MKIRNQKKAVMIREYGLDIGTIRVYNDYMTSHFDEGASLTVERAYQIIGIAEIHFNGRPFGFISYRQNSYSIDPTIYTYLRSLKNLKAFAIVSKKEIDMHNFNIEKLFYKKSMEFFIEFENALKWVKRRVQVKKRKY